MSDAAGGLSPGASPGADPTGRLKDAPIEWAFQELASLAAVLAGTPMAAIGLVDADRAEVVGDRIAHGLRFMADAPVLRTSAKTGAGVGRIFERVERLHAAAQRKIGTAELNRWLQATVRRHEPAMGQRGSRRRPLKFFYATQTATRPPTFVLFASQPDEIPEDYKRFLINGLRRDFDIPGTPIRLYLRAGENPYAGRRKPNVTALDKRSPA